MTGFAGWGDCWNQLDWGRIRFVGNDLLFVPLVSFTGRAPCMTEILSFDINPLPALLAISDIYCHLHLGSGLAR